jgi:uncharacterized phage protein gp47/JayE
MAEIEFPTRDNIKQSAKSDVRSELQGSNPFIKVQWLSSIVTSWAFRLFDFYEKLKELLVQVFWDTAELPYLSRWAAIFNITTKAASQASGNIVAEGTPGSAIPISEKLAVSGIQYRTTTAGTIAAQSLSVASLVRVGSTVTITTASAHNWATGIQVTISGAVETEYNGVQTIFVTGDTTATYQIETTPTSPATGTILADFNTALLPVQADTGFAGSDTNQDSGAQLNFVTPVAGVNNATFVDFTGLTGGADQESTEDNRIRFLNRVQNPVANFNVAAITQAVLSVPGNTRAFVHEVTPAIGQVTTYFTRDNDGIIPTAGDVTTTKAAVDEIKPANTDTTDNIVLAPTPKVVPFVFSALTPNTSAMQDAINLNLDVFFQEKTAVGQDLTENEYVAAIQNTIDIETGETLTSFALTTPSGNVSVATGEIPTKGTVTFPP